MRWSAVSKMFGSGLRSFQASPTLVRIAFLLFGKVEPVAAVASNCPHVLVRIQLGLERENYGVTYREAQAQIETEIPKQFYARQRAFLLLKGHGQTLCKRSKPKCGECLLRLHCAYSGGENADETGRNNTNVRFPHRRKNESSATLSTWP